MLSNLLKKLVHTTIVSYNDVKGNRFRLSDRRSRDYNVSVLAVMSLPTMVVPSRSVARETSFFLDSQRACRFPGILGKTRVMRNRTTSPATARRQQGDSKATDSRPVHKASLSESIRKSSIRRAVQPRRVQRRVSLILSK